MLDNPLLIPITLAIFLFCCLILVLSIFRRHLKSIEFHKQQMESYSNFSSDLKKYQEELEETSQQEQDNHH